MEQIVYDREWALMQAEHVALIGYLVELWKGEEETEEKTEG